MATNETGHHGKRMNNRREILIALHFFYVIIVVCCVLFRAGGSRLLGRRPQKIIQNQLFRRQRSIKLSARKDFHDDDVGSEKVCVVTSN